MLVHNGDKHKKYFCVFKMHRKYNVHISYAYVHCEPGLRPKHKLCTCIKYSEEVRETIPAPEICTYYIVIILICKQIKYATGVKPQAMFVCYK